MAPVKRRLQGLLPLHATTSTGEEAEPVVELLEDLLGRQVPYARRGELDREGNAIEASTQIGDRLSVGARQLERRAYLPGPLNKQRDCLALDHVAARQLKRRHPPGLLAVDQERLAACREHRQTRARPLQAVDERGQRFQ